MPNTPLRAMLFDLDGTLLDTNGQHVIAWSQALASFGVAIGPDRLEVEMGKGGDILVPSLLGAQAERDQGDALRRAHRAAFRQLFDTARPRWLPGVEEVLAEARRRGIRTALATSTGLADVKFLEERMTVRLQRIFDVVVTSDDAARSKPEPDILQVCCERLGLSPLSCAMVGDSLHDATAARRAGMSFVGMTTGYVRARELDEAGARYICVGLDKLATHLDAAVDVLWPSRMAYAPAELEALMRVALEAAAVGVSEGEAPIGAALFDADGVLLATGHNRALASGDVTEHAELDALRSLARQKKKLGRGATLVSTLEPCVMCLGAAMMASVDVVVFGLRAPADGGTTRVAAPRSDESKLPRVLGGVLADEARAAFQRWLDAGPADEKQRPYAEQLLRETSGEPSR